MTARCADPVRTTSARRSVWSTTNTREGSMATALMVWIDQDLCTGDGICEEICGDVFTARDDGLWVVKEEAKHFGAAVLFDGREGPGHGPDGGRGVARIPDALVDSAVEA